MELDVKDWLIVLGALLIVGVLLDAYRRYRNERRNPIRMGRSSLGMGGGFPRDGVESPNTELPTGGARVITREGSAGRSDAPRTGRVEPRLDAGSEAIGAADAPQAPAPGQDGDGDADADGEVLVLRLVARGGAGFPGTELMRILEACDVRFGDMHIFHRHEAEKGQGPVQFSIVNAVEPGTFDPETIADFRTPGLNFFMRLPGPSRPLEAFDCMLETARTLARYLDGEVRDESNSVFTQQTGEHCRQRIREFSLRAHARR